MPFSVLIYRLCIEFGVQILIHLDQMVEDLHTIDPSLIKAAENPIALQRAQHPPMPKRFMPEPQVRGSITVATTTQAATYDEGP